MNHATRSLLSEEAGTTRVLPNGSPRGLLSRRCGRMCGRLLTLAVLGSGMLGACSLDGLLKSNELPPDVTDPAITKTPEGARAAYHGALLRFLQEVGGRAPETFIATTGLLSDELIGLTGTVPFITTNPVDSRNLAEQPGVSFGPFEGLSNVRQRARQARGLLQDYLPEEPALRAHLYAVEGYAEVLLAELYCSGIPLSTVDYNGDYTLRPGSTTTEVLTHAQALFDSALALTGDSARILNLSRVGKARALLGLGDYAAAAAAVVEVPDTFRYTLHYTSVDTLRGVGLVVQGIWESAGIANGEGTNGLDYRTSADPRTPDSLLASGFYHPKQYHVDGVDTVVLASGVEARLIEAEAALQAGDPAWLTTLNALRTDGTYDLTAASPPDTLWHAGTGGVAGLRPLQDPGSDTARVSLLFRERAFWLFLTGHRQGDMRRLVRQYHRLQSQVYPVGPSADGSPYGQYIDLPIPWEERTLNPLFTGCGSRD